MAKLTTKGTVVEKQPLSVNESDRLSMQELFKRLSSSADGLSQNKAQRRLSRYGYNEIPEKKSSPVLKFLSYSRGPIQPVDPVHKRTEATVRARDGGTFKTTKGAPQVVLKVSLYF